MTDDDKKALRRAAKPMSFALYDLSAYARTAARVTFGPLSGSISLVMRGADARAFYRMLDARRHDAARLARLVPVGSTLRRRRAWNALRDDDACDAVVDGRRVNLYGCTDCPRCGSRCRYVPVRAARVLCDDCGYRERVRLRPAVRT